MKKRCRIAATAAFIIIYQASVALAQDAAAIAAPPTAGVNQAEAGDGSTGLGRPDQDHQARQSGPDGGQLPLAITAQDNLGRAGLLRSYFESDQYGTVQWRVGQARQTIGSAANSSLPHSTYRDGTSDVVVPVNFLFTLPDRESMIHLAVRGTFSNGAHYPVELDGDVGRLDLKYIRFLDPHTMVSIGGLYEQNYMDIEGAGSVKHAAGGIRGDVLNEFSEHWGIAARAEFAWGETDLSVAAGPGLTMRHKQGDDHLYTQAELIGQYRNDDIGIVPQGWVLHPVLGVQFQRSFEESTANNFGVVSSGVVGATEDYSTAWAHLRLEKESPPNHLSPNVIVGFERELVNDLDGVVSEPNYAVFGAGVSIMSGKGQRFEIGYLRHQGLEDNRWNESFVGTMTMSF